MKSIRKYISLILLIFVFCTVVDVNNLPYLHAEEVVVNLYDLNNSVETFDLDLESTYAILFNAGIPIKEVQLYIDNAPVNRSKLEMDLYSFDTSYGNTIRKEAIVSKTFERFGRDTWLSFEIGNINAGEYLLVITPKQGNIKVKVSEGKLDTVRMYENTSSLNMNFFCRLVLEKGDGNSLEKVSDFKNKFIALPDTWACTDGLNRTLPLQKDVGKKREDKYVGVFFHTWHSRFSAHSFADISQILKQNPNEKNSSNINWGDKFSYFWSEPIWGYYDTRDKWVLRKQAEMLADAGVDVIIMDNTNGTDIFKEGLLSLLQVFSEARADGVKTPQVSFMLPMFGPYEDTANQLRQLYDLIYSKGRYEDLWFYWKGKPLMMGCPDALRESNPIDKAILDFFTFRPANPSYREDYAQIFDEQGNVHVYIRPLEGHITWQWITVMPQQVAYNTDGTPEQVCVSVAQNWSNEQGLAPMSFNEPEKLFGRSYSHSQKGHDKRDNAPLYGKNFEEQWEFALKVDPEFIFITGWNEWRAGLNNEIWGTKNAFADTFDDNNSRDIEPSKGDLKDHYYYQMVSYIRKFKGASDVPKASKPVTIDIHSSTDQWKDISPYFASYQGNNLDRYYRGYGGLNYKQEGNKNDIVGAKVARDDEFIYFMVDTREDIHIGDNFMRLLIDVEDTKHKEAANWETFEYIVNRVAPGDKAIVERSVGGWNWEKVGEVDYSINGNRLQLKVPKAMLGIDRDEFTINFKWSDNMKDEGDIMDFYVNGNVAPGGRFKYRYSTATEDANPVSTFVKYIVPVLVFVIVASFGLAILFKKNRKRKG
jgi:hypothetical protein